MNLSVTLADLEKYLSEKDEDVKKEVKTMGDKDYVPWSERVRNEGREEGRERGDLLRRISLVCKKLNKGLSIPVIADHIEESTDFVEQICTLAAAYAPDYDVEQIADDYLRKIQ